MEQCIFDITFTLRRNAFKRCYQLFVNLQREKKHDGVARELMKQSQSEPHLLSIELFKGQEKRVKNDGYECGSRALAFSAG